MDDEDESKEENDNERIDNIRFMAMGEIDKVCPTSVTYWYKCDELQENIELVLNDFEKVLNEYNKLMKEKKNWEI